MWHCSGLQMGNVSRHVQLEEELSYCSTSSTGGITAWTLLAVAGWKSPRGLLLVLRAGHSRRTINTVSTL